MEELARGLRIFEEFERRRGEPGAPATLDELVAAHPELASVLRGFAHSVISSVDGRGDARLRLEEGAWVDGRYRVRRTLGAGGMGVVVLAHDEHDDVDVALKFLRPELVGSKSAVDRQLREASMRHLEHPNIGRVLRHESGDDPYLVMEYVEGHALDRVLAAREGPDPAHDDEILRACADLAFAVHHAHERGVVHRDIKPGNVILRPDGSPVLLDFGLARAVEASVALTMSGDLVGTPAYMAPEQLEGHRADASGDVYALGVLLYEWLGGRRPFDEVTPQAVLAAISKGRKRPLTDVRPDLSPAVALVVDTAMAREQGDRYASAALLAEDLRALADGRPIAARRHGTWGRLVRWARREPLPARLGAGLVATTLLTGVGAWEATRQRDAAAASAEVADEERDAARRAAAEAEAERARAEEALQQTRLLAAQARVEEARGIAEDLPPPWPENADTFSMCLELIDDLDRIEPELEVALAEAGAESAERDLVASSYRRTLHDIRELRDEHRPFVEDALAWSREVEQRSILDHELQWKAAILSIRESDGEFASELYDGLAITPQMGLVPLGMDPESKLWEFVHLRSGERGNEFPDVDDETGRWIVRPETGLVFVLIPGGTATIGAQSKDPGKRHYDRQARDFDESPVHDVELSAFFISKYEMTQSQWARLTLGDWPAYFNVGFQNIGGLFVGETHPVESVSWHRAKAVLEMHGLVLPTEAQWERAARAGTATSYFTGNSVMSLQGHANILDSTSKLWRDDTGYDPSVTDGYVGHAPVGSFAPNAFGVHDIIGNVKEWCLDPQFRYVYPSREGDGLRLGMGDGRVNRIARGGESMRAGGWRSASRDRARPEVAGGSTGVRPLRPVIR